jgi:hypothetical protein
MNHPARADAPRQAIRVDIANSIMHIERPPSTRPVSWDGWIFGIDGNEA